MALVHSLRQLSDEAQRAAADLRKLTSTPRRRATSPADLTDAIRRNQADELVAALRRKLGLDR